jgi:hypothetical protein
MNPPFDKAVGRPWEFTLARERGGEDDHPTDEDYEAVFLKRGCVGGSNSDHAFYIAGALLKARLRTPEPVKRLGALVRGAK